jgi:hypothetical protein
MTEESTAGPLVTPRSGINGIPYDAIAGSATCQLLAAGAGISATIAVNSVLTGQIWGLVGGSAGLLAANGLAAANGCFPVNPDGGPAAGGQGIAAGQCMEAANGCNLRLYYGGEGREGNQYTTVRKLISSVASGQYPNGTPKCTTTMVNCDGETYTDDEAISDLWPITTEVINGDVCAGDPSPDYQPALPDPVPVPDPDGGDCTYNTQLIDSYINAAGGMSILYETCATGPGCSGCSRFWYHGPGNVQPAPPEPIPGPDGKPLPQPNPEGPGGDCPDPCEPCKWQPVEPPEAGITPRTVSFTSACGEGDDGKVETVNYSLPGAATLKDSFEALSQQNTQIMAMLQQHLLWKTPTCPPETPELEGEFRTISFRSNETSPYGKSRLRKRLRYRSSSGIGLGELVDHWKDFTFVGGPVRVRHVGSSWGTVEVWALTEDEGKRVILHAAGEAGIDPNQVGRWSARRSNSSRLGVSLQMNVDTTGGYYWITERDGSDGRPLVAT